LRNNAPRPSTSRRGFLQAVTIGGVGAALSTAAIATPAQALDAPMLAGDGVTDDAPALQAMYDNSTTPVFVAGKSYLLNSPIFLDKPDPTAMWVLELNGATLKLGAGLPTTDSFARDLTTKWAIFPNTVRSALSGGIVATGPSTRATGTSSGALISLILRNGTVEGDGANAGLAFANRTGCKFESIVLRRGRALLSWRDYGDLNVFIQCHNRAGGPKDSVLVDQISSGDGLLMQSCKSDASVGLARLKYCRGAEIVGTVTGRIELDMCSAIQIRGGHQETPIANETMIEIRNSDVVIDSTALYLARGPVGTVLPAAVRIIDRGGIPSQVVFRDSVEMRALLSSDEQLGQLLSVDNPIEGTRIEARGLSSVVSARDVGGVWNRSAGPVFGGISEINAAVAKTLATVGSGNFELSNLGSGWVVRQTTVPESASSGAPIIAPPASSDALAGTLTTASQRYRCQGVLSSGKLTAASTYSAVIATATGTVKFTVSTVGPSQELRIWRFTVGTPQPNAYIAIPAGSSTHTFYDSGQAINGFVWLPGTTRAAP
jgi:hypothetical protein